MTDESFLTEIRQLKVDLGPSVTMRVRSARLPDDRATMAAELFGLLVRSVRSLRDLAEEANPFLCLYPIEAHPGDRPQIIVDVPDSPDVYQIEPGRLVEVHGIPRPGHAVVVVIDGRTYWPAYPARTKGRPPRL
jgi:hypothetical protein